VPTAMGTIIDGRAIAARMRERLRADLAGLGVTPHLRVLYFETPSSRVYWAAQRHAAEQLGIATAQAGGAGSVGCPWSVGWPEVEAIIQRWNRDPGVHGIFVHQPLPPQIDPEQVSTLIDPGKDVEGIHPEHFARRFFAKARIGSCTALAVMELIDSTGVQLDGREAVVVGHSEIVGRPVSMLLLDKLATTTVCHVGTDRAGRLEEHVRRADVLVVAVGQPRLIQGAWIKPGAVVIDVGINVVGGKVVGDVEFDAAKDRAAFISPVPGGVGPVTVMTVMRNTVSACRQQAARS